MNLRRPRGNVTTRLVAGIDPATAEGRAKAFRLGAEECLGGAKKLHTGFPDTGEYVLTFHSLELALKSFLAKGGVSDAALAKNPYGHNLQALYSEATKRGLKVSVPHVEAIIEWVNEYHDKGALLRYDFTQTRELPNCSTIFPIIEEILAASKS